jgi:hypothetical protein
MNRHLIQLLTAVTAGVSLSLTGWAVGLRPSSSLIVRWNGQALDPVAHGGRLLRRRGRRLLR